MNQGLLLAAGGAALLWYLNQQKQDAGQTAGQDPAAAHSSAQPASGGSAIPPVGDSGASASAASASGGASAAPAPPPNPPLNTSAASRAGFADKSGATQTTASQTVAAPTGTSASASPRSGATKSNDLASIYTRMKANADANGLTLGSPDAWSYYLIQAAPSLPALDLTEVFPGYDRTNYLTLTAEQFWGGAAPYLTSVYGMAGPRGPARRMALHPYGGWGDEMAESWSGFHGYRGRV